LSAAPGLGALSPQLIWRSAEKVSEYR
jgi:hypothetical protein